MSFLSANYVGIVFLKYYFDSEDNPKTVYLHSKPYRNYQNVYGGLIDTTNNNVGILKGTRFVANMYEAYKRDEKDAGSILFLVTYYIDSNANNLFTSFILTVACIELLWNWMMVEKLKLFSKKEKKRELGWLSSKIIILASFVDISLCKSHFSEKFQKFIMNHDKYHSVQSAIALLRNAHVHPIDSDNTRKLLIDPNNYPAEICFEAREILLAIIDKYLLIFGSYTGQYYNRLSKKSDSFSKETCLHIMLKYPSGKR